MVNLIEKTITLNNVLYRDCTLEVWVHVVPYGLFTAVEQFLDYAKSNGFSPQGVVMTPIPVIVHNSGIYEAL